jgi:hypothetical protein
LGFHFILTPSSFILAFAILQTNGGLKMQLQSTNWRKTMGDALLAEGGFGYRAFAP